MIDELRKVKVSELHDVCTKIFTSVSVPPEEAEIIVSSLVEADQRGILSHGIMAIPRYVSLIQKGTMRSKTSYEVVCDHGCVCVWDGHRSNGQVLGYKAMHEAVNRARIQGLAVVAVKKSNHFGAGAFYAQIAEKAHMIGIVTSTGSPTMAPWGGADRLLGNNPLSIAVPTETHVGMVLDMAQSNVAFGKISNVIKQGGKKIPLGWAFDENGVETCDVEQAYSAIPMGNHKGYGLAVIIDVIAGILFGGATGIRAGDGSEGPSHLFMAINIAAFNENKKFLGDVDARIDELKGSRLAPGSLGIYMPGEIEAKKFEQSKEYVSVIPEAVNDINELAATLIPGYQPLEFL